jgi:hypothetical protein
MTDCEFPCFQTCAVALPPYPKTTSREAAREDLFPYPNPAHSAIAIPYSISEEGNVVGIISDLNGREVVRSTTETRPAGDWSIAVDVSELARGAYLYSIECNGRRVASGPLTIAW